MKTKLTLILLFLASASSLFSIDTGSIVMQTYYHPIRTKEEFYSLYRQNMHRKVENLNANIFWLEHAKKAPFDHPVKALAKIESEEQWKIYRTLFMLQMNFLIMKDYILLAEQYDKPHILFFNPPFTKELTDGFEISKVYYKRAQEALKESESLADIAWEQRDNLPLSLDGELDKWADIMYKLKNIDIYHEINYTKELQERLNKIDTKLQQLPKNDN